MTKPKTIRPRIYIVGATKAHVAEVRTVLRQLRTERNFAVETRTFVGIDDLLPTLDRYINLVIFNYRGRQAGEIKNMLPAFRAAYSGRMILINDDQSVHPCIWGRFYGMNYLAPTAAGLKSYIHRALARPATRGKTALVFAGGGILGGFTEIGVYNALHDLGLREFDMYIGLSAGAFVATVAAHRIPPRRMIEEQGLGLLDFYSPNIKDAISKSVFLVPNVVHGILRHLRGPSRDLVFLLSSLFPSSALTGTRIARALTQQIEASGGTNSFRDLRERGVELYLTAMDLDSTELRVFGEDNDLDVPISDAVRASGALPLAYKPVEIDGRQYIDGGIHTTANIDVAIRHGADLIICVNPLVPYVSDVPGHIQSLGPIGVAEQSYRTLLHRRLHRDIQYYKIAHPKCMTLLIEPDLRDQALFHNPLNADPELIGVAIAKGYDAVRNYIEQDWDFVERSFHFHGRPIQRTVIDRVSQALRHSDLTHEALKEVFAAEAEAS